MAVNSKIYIYIAVSIVIASVLIFIGGIIWLRKRRPIARYPHHSQRVCHDQEIHSKPAGRRGTGIRGGKCTYDDSVCDEFGEGAGAGEYANSLLGHKEALGIERPNSYDHAHLAPPKKISGGHYSPIPGTTIEYSKCTYPPLPVPPTSPQKDASKLPKPPTPSYSPHGRGLSQALSGSTTYSPKTPAISLRTDLPPRPPPKDDAIISPLSPDNGGNSYSMGITGRTSFMNGVVSPVDEAEPPRLAASYLRYAGTIKNDHGTRKQDIKDIQLDTSKKNLTPDLPTSEVPVLTTGSPPPANSTDNNSSGEGNFNNPQHGKTNSTNPPPSSASQTLQITTQAYPTSDWDAAELQRRRLVRERLHSVAETVMSTATNTTTVSTVLAFSDDDLGGQWVLEDGRWVVHEEDFSRVRHRSQGEVAPPVPPLPPLSQLASIKSIGTVRRKPAPGDATVTGVSNPTPPSTDCNMSLKNAGGGVSPDDCHGGFMPVYRGGRMRSNTSPANLERLTHIEDSEALQGQKTSEKHIHHLSTSTLITSGGVLFTDDEGGSDCDCDCDDDCDGDGVLRNASVPRKKLVQNYYPQLDFPRTPRPAYAGDHHGGPTMAPFNHVAGKQNMRDSSDMNMAKTIQTSLSRSSSLFVELGPSRRGTVGNEKRPGVQRFNSSEPEGCIESEKS